MKPGLKQKKPGCNLTARFVIFYLVRIIRRLKYNQPGKLQHKNRNQCKDQGQSYRYRLPKLHLPDIRQCMFHMQYTLQKFYMP